MYSTHIINWSSVANYRLFNYSQFVFTHSHAKTTTPNGYLLEQLCIYAKNMFMPEYCPYWDISKAS